MESLGPKIAESLGLENPGEYTSHFMRRSAATVAANSGLDTTDLKRKFKWMSSKSAERSEIYWKQKFNLQFRYVADSTERAAEFSERVSSFIERKCNPEEKPAAQLARAEAATDPRSHSNFSGAQVQSVTINNYFGAGFANHDVK